MSNSAESKQYYVFSEGANLGPFDEQKLHEMVSNGAFSPQSNVWTEGMEQWQPYDQVFASAPETPPVPDAAPSPEMPPVPNAAPSPGMPPVPDAAPAPGMPPVPDAAPAPGMPPVPGMPPIPQAASAPYDDTVLQCAKHINTVLQYAKRVGNAVQNAAQDAYHKAKEIQQQRREAQAQNVPQNARGRQRRSGGFRLFNWEWTEISFKGRLCRRRYWLSVLYWDIILIILGIIRILFSIASDSDLAVLIGMIFSLLVDLPLSIYNAVCGLSRGIRRLHDIDKSWVALLIGLIPVVGWIILIVWLCRDSSPYTNMYGENPKPEELKKRGHTLCPACNGIGRDAYGVSCVMCMGRGYELPGPKFSQQQGFGAPAGMPGYPQQQGFGAPPAGMPGYPQQQGYGAPPAGMPGYPQQQGFGAPAGMPGYPQQQGYGAPPAGMPAYPQQQGYGAPPAGMPAYPQQQGYGAPPAGMPGYPQQQGYGAPLAGMPGYPQQPQNQTPLQGDNQPETTEQ